MVVFRRCRMHYKFQRKSGHQHLGKRVYGSAFQVHHGSKPDFRQYPPCSLTDRSNCCTFLVVVATDYGLFPRPFGELALDASVKKMRLSLTQGRFNLLWGEPSVTVPNGGELKAEFDEVREDPLDKSWKRLVNTLSAVTCSAVELMENETTVFLTPNEAYGTLPRESVCTENLTPWLKFLPCRNFVSFLLIFFLSFPFFFPFSSRSFLFFSSFTLSV